MSKSIVEKIREDVVARYQKTIHSPIPLANPETVFTHGSWKNIFYFIDTHPALLTLEERDNQKIKIKFESLYFRKMYLQCFDFGSARRMMRHVADMPSWCFQLDGDDHHKKNENRLNIKHGIEFDLDPDTQFSRTIGRITKRFDVVVFGISPEKCPATWKTTEKQFLKFTDTVEKIFIGQGEVLQFRAAMTVYLPHANIDLHYNYNVPSVLHYDFIDKKVKKEYTPPEAVITFK